MVGLDGAEQRLTGGVLEQVALGPGLDGIEEHLVPLEHAITISNLRSSQDSLSVMSPGCG